MGKWCFFLHHLPIKFFFSYEKNAFFFNIQKIYIFMYFDQIWGFLLKKWGCKKVFQINFEKWAKVLLKISTVNQFFVPIFIRLYISDFKHG